MMRRSLQVLAMLSCVIICIIAKPNLLIRTANATIAAPDAVPPPLPGPKSGFGTPGDTPLRACCLYGYVFWEGKPVDSAIVTVSLNTLITTTQTVTSSQQSYPSYFIALDAEATSLGAGTPITVTATYHGESRHVRYVIQEAGQQVDMVIAHSKFACTEVGEIPVSECEALTTIYDSLNGPNWLNHTNWLQTNTPCSWAGVSCANSHVIALALPANDLIGTFPPEIGRLSRLTALNLHANRITGSIPEELGNLMSLTALDLSNNQLSGPIPVIIGNLVLLQQLKLESNQFSGAIPYEFIGLSALTTLDLSYNALLAVSDTLHAFLNTKAPGWEATQTVAPQGFQAKAQAEDKFLLTWTPVVYQGDGGYYEISLADSDTARFAIKAQLPKSSSSYVLLGLQPQHNYFVRIRTYTPPHGEQINSVWNAISPVLAVKSLRKMPLIALAAGDHHTCAAMDFGKVKCWGLNTTGQLGNNTLESSLVPTEVLNLPGPVGLLTGGENHTCAVTFGKMQCWGFDYYGTLGDDPMDQDRPYPVNVRGLNHEIISVGAGNQHTCAVLADGSVKCWGNNGNLQIGVPEQKQYPTPVEVTGLQARAIAIAGGSVHNCAVLENGAVQCWGFNNAGQLGNGQINGNYLPGEPVQGFSETRRAVAVAAGEIHSCALTDSGDVYCWGDNEYGQLGAGNFDKNVDFPNPVKVIGLGLPAKAIAAGNRYTCALLDDASVKCWGLNDHGQLGDGSVEAKAEPVSVIGLSGEVTAITTGNSHTCVAMAAGGAMCWGKNKNGQLGDGTTEDRTIPVEVQDFILPPPRPQSWTFLIYAVGDNNLAPVLGEGPDGMVHRLLNTKLPVSVSVGILYDGPINGDTKRFKIRTSDQITITLPEASMDVSDTLRSFVAWGLKEFQSDYYYLAILDHANGVVGIGYDDTTTGQNQSYLEPQEIRMALQDAMANGPARLNIVHFDGCSFGLFEDTSIVHDLADYVIASPNTGWGIFAYDQYAKLAGQSDNEPRNLAIHVADTYKEQLQQNIPKPLPFTIAVFDMSVYSVTKNAINAMGNSLAEYIKDSAHAVELQAKRDTVIQKYDSGNYNITQADHYVDVYSLAKALTTLTDSQVVSAATSVSATQDKFVIMEHHASGTFPHPQTGITITQSLDGSNGLGIYYPPTDSGPGPYCDYVNNKTFPWLTDGWRWTSFLNKLSNKCQSTQDDLIPTLPPPRISISSLVYLPIITR